MEDVEGPDIHNMKVLKLNTEDVHMYEASLSRTKFSRSGYDERTLVDGGGLRNSRYWRCVC